MTAVAAWVCPSCRGTVSSAYCPRCGERPLHADDLTLHGLALQALEAVTNVDGKLLRSLRSLATRPGLLTLAFIEGRRRAFIGPVSLFLVSNVIFFAVESLTGGTIFATPLRSHLHTQPWSETVQPLVAGRLAALDIPLDALAARFDALIAVQARSLILVMALAFAPVQAAVFHRSRRSFAVHAVFALHLYAFMLLLFAVATAVPAAGMLLGRTRSTSEALDLILSAGLLAACGVYLYRAVSVVYDTRGAVRLAQAVALTMAMAAIVLGYRFALFLLSLYFS